MTIFKRYIRLIWQQLAYIIVSIVYLIKLHLLNQTLLASDFADNILLLLSYNNYQPIWYFLISVGFLTVGVALIINKFRKTNRSIMNCAEVTIWALTIICVVTLLVLHIIFINNPILQAVVAGLLLVVSGLLTLQRN